MVKVGSQREYICNWDDIVSKIVENVKTIDFKKKNSQLIGIGAASSMEITKLIGVGVVSLTDIIIIKFCW